MAEAAVARTAVGAKLERIEAGGVATTTRRTDEGNMIVLPVGCAARQALDVVGGVLLAVKGMMSASRRASCDGPLHGFPRFAANPAE
jgi:hypothetical protein